MRMSKRRVLPFSLGRASAICLSLAAAFMLAACGGERGAPETAQTPPVAPSPDARATRAEQNTPVAAAPSATPTPTPAPVPAAEVSNKVARTFQGAVQIVTARRDAALVGDFNDDGSEDIAVFVKPNPSKLEEINGQVSHWILNDPQKTALPDPKKAVQVLPPAVRVKIEANDELLAVIHGYAKGGWRDPAAQQIYLLRNAAGNAARVLPWQDAFGIPKAGNPHRRGDVIREELNRAPGFIYWTGAKYAWHAEATPGAK